MSFLGPVPADIAFLASLETGIGFFEIAASLGNSDSQEKEALSQEVSMGGFF